MIKVSIDRKVMKSAMSGVADQIRNKMDLNQVKKLCKKQYGIETINGIEHKDANIVVIENQVGCKLDLEVRFAMSVFISTNENSKSTLPEKIINNIHFRGDSSSFPVKPQAIVNSIYLEEGKDPAYKDSDWNIVWINPDLFE